MINLKKIMVIFISFVLILISSWGWAQENYPNKPIQLICPWPAGGSIDILARSIAEKMAEYLGRPVLVENKTGAAGALGINFVANSKPDGYTLVITGAALGAVELLPLLNPNITFKYTDFIPLASFSRYTQVAVVNKETPVKTLAELVDYIKKNPGTLSFCSGGIGSPGHLLYELWRLTHKDLDIPHIPYAGQAAALTALLGNHSQIAFFPSGPPGSKHIETGEIRALAVTSPKRFPFLPQVPTAVEQGFPEMILDAYYFLWVPKKTPASIVKKLESTIEKATQDKEFGKKLEKQDCPIDFKNSQEALRLVEDSIRRWEPVIKQAGITIK